MSEITNAMKKMLKEAAEKGADGFSRQALGVDRNAKPEVLQTWGEIVGQDLVTPRFNANDESPIILTPKGFDAIGMEYNY